MKYLSFFIVLILVSCTSTQTITKVDLTPTEAIKAFQKKLNDDYKNPETSPLQKKAVDFETHHFFPIDLTYRVKAKVILIPDSKPFLMPTSGVRKPKYRKYARLSFMLKGEKRTLTLYQNMDLIKNPVYKDYLFLPFTDLTNGEETYGGGRYIDFRIPKSDEVILDFNQAYNPYCAYTDGYSCPIPPTENNLELEVRAGIILKK